MIGDVFDPQREWEIHEAARPHWFQTGTISFFTFRTQDSIPREVLERWEREKQEWLHRLGISSGIHWCEVLSSLSEELRTKFYKQFKRQREDFLDTCHGRYLLQNANAAKIVADALQHFDGDRYQLGDFVVMPNHVHLLVSFISAEAMQQQCDSWLHYTARQINLLTGESGKFWQQEPFDHLVRSVEQYEWLRKYIADNPSKAGLGVGQYLYHRSEK
ncbi:MAG: transposase [Planctomycetota bacterium]|nr:transposase [Planctomycetota bacterium]